MIYGEDYTVRWHDTDAAGEARPSKVLEYMQETANRQFYANGTPLDDLFRNHHLGFLLSRIAVSFDAPLRAYEQIHAETFTVNSHGISYGRGYRILRGEETVARGMSAWALIRTDTHEMVRVCDCPVCFGDEPAIEIPVPLRFRIPADAELVEVGTRTVRCSDLDFNFHMNNTRYPDMLCDFLPDAPGRRIRGMSVSFLREAAFGETLTVLCAKSATNPDQFFLRTVRQDGQVNVEAMILTEKR